MMNARQIVLTLSVIGAASLIFALSLPVFGQSGIIVNNADAVQNTPVSVSQDLIDSISGIQPRIVMLYANTVRKLNLSAIPATLQTLLEQLTSRIVFQYADTNRAIELSSAPQMLQTLLAQVAPRIVFQYANTNRHLPLSFPVDLIGDETPPQGSSISVKPVGETSTTIAWITDEYADSTVRCGTQPANYTMIFSDPLYVKEHSITLTDLIPGTTYYCVCSSADLSGNTYQSQEFSFEQFVQPSATITKLVSPEGQVQYGDELTYTLVISGVSGAEVGVYDPLTSTTFVRFLEQPAGIAYADHAITGTMTITPTNHMTVSFVAQVNVPGTVGIYVDVSNAACVYPAGKTISSCVWSNTIINQAYQPYTVFLPVVVRNQ